jgi:hypothetical protein
MYFKNKICYQALFNAFAAIPLYWDLAHLSALFPQKQNFEHRTFAVEVEEYKSKAVDC